MERPGKIEASMWLSNQNFGVLSPFLQVEVVYTTPAASNLGGNGNVHLAQVCMCVFFSTDLYDMSENALKSAATAKKLGIMQAFAARTNLMVVLH